MAREKVDDQIVSQWILLHRKGRSFRSIGQEYGVDPRTVKSRLEKAGEEYEKEHWEAVTKVVDAKYLDEHYRMLIQMTSAVTEMVSINPLNTIQKQLAPSYFNICIESTKHKVNHLLTARGFDVTSEREVDISQESRIGHKLFDALMEHEPSLKINIDAWKSDWIKFQKTRFNLMEEAKNLFTQFKITDSIAERIKKKVIDEVFHSKILSEEPCSSRVDTSDKDDEHIRDKYKRSKLVWLIRYNKHLNLKVYKGSIEEVSAICQVYDEVFPQLCHEERLRPVRDSYLHLMKQVKEVEDYVDRLILIGRPQGQCSLCLNRQTHLPSSEE